MVTLNTRSVSDQITAPTFDEALVCIREWRTANPTVKVTGFSGWPASYSESIDANDDLTLSITISYDIPVDELTNNGGY